MTDNGRRVDYGVCTRSLHKYFARNSFFFSLSRTLLKLLPPQSARVVVFEWGRGPGGRTARRRVQAEGEDLLWGFCILMIIEVIPNNEACHSTFLHMSGESTFWKYPYVVERLAGVEKRPFLLPDIRSCWVRGSVLEAELAAISVPAVAAFDKMISCERWVVLFATASEACLLADP